MKLINIRYTLFLNIAIRLTEASMYKFNHTILALLLLIVGCSSTSKVIAQDDWKLVIAPEQNKRAVMEITSETSFYVVLNNTSEDGKRFWNSNNSWGYSVLYFILQNSLGKTFEIRKKQKSWRKNAPVYTHIPSGGDFNFAIDFADDTWEMPELSVGIYYVQAIILVPEDGKSKQEKVWTGKIKSKKRKAFVRKN